MPPLNHMRPSSRNTLSIGPEHPWLHQIPPPRMMTLFVIPLSQATQAHFSMTPDTVLKVMREVSEQRKPEPGLQSLKELMMSIEQLSLGSLFCHLLLSFNTSQYY